MRTFATDVEFSEALEAALAPEVASKEIRAALAAGIGAGEQDSRTGPALEDGSLNLRLSSWVLRDQDIPMTELIGAVAAAITIAVAPGAIVAGALVTALSSFASLAWKAWRKGARLTRPEVAVLGFLEVEGPMPDGELVAKASASIEGVSPVDVERAILTLQEVELRDGDLVSLIRKDAAGLWRARPV